MLTALDPTQTKKAIAKMNQLIDEASANENATPFINLPSKRYYGDYFRTIE